MATRWGAMAPTQPMDTVGSSNLGVRALYRAVTLRRYANALMDQR